jgi:K+-sensing histidine kinase KdpD
MKIKKNEFVSTRQVIKNPEDIILKILKPFSLSINKKGINTRIIRKNTIKGEIRIDQKNLKLALFNLGQNAVKYNCQKGDIMFVISITTNDEKKQNYLEIDIIDTGVGIDKERQNYLFIPFLELKIKQDMRKVTNNSIGIGLACSRDIITAIGGKLSLKHSEKGLTVFNVKVPVDLENPGLFLEESIDEAINQRKKYFTF